MPEETVFLYACTAVDGKPHSGLMAGCAIAQVCKALEKQFPFSTLMWIVPVEGVTAVRNKDGNVTGYKLKSGVGALKGVTL